MIKYLNSQSPDIQVSHYGGSPYIQQGAPSAGLLRYMNNEMQVYDGNGWQTITGHADVRLSSDAELVINWAKQKMTEEMRLQELMERHPGLKDAYEKFEIMKILVTEGEQKNG